MSGGVSGLQELRGKSLLIFDDGLASRDGHWLEYDSTVAAMHAELGVRTTIVCDASFRAPDELTNAGVEVLPLIAMSPWRDLANGRGFRDLGRNLVLGWHFRQILVRLLRERSYDCVLHPAAMACHMMAWGLMPAAARRRSSRTVFATWVTYASYDAEGAPRFGRRLFYWKLMRRWLKREFQTGRFAFKTDSDRLAAEYRIMADLPASTMPSPGLTASPAQAAEAANASVCFGSVGPARMEKGIDLLQEAIKDVLSDGRDPAMRFVIQWSRPVDDGRGGVLPPSVELTSDPRIRLLTEPLLSSEYRMLLEEIDCMVLPYRRSAYYSRGSGVVVEAACAGIPMIYTADTWLSEFVDRQGAGIAVPDGDPLALAAALREMTDNYPEYQAKAAAQAVIANQKNSPTAFVQSLWGIPA